MKRILVLGLLNTLSSVSRISSGYKWNHLTFWHPSSCRSNLRMNGVHQYFYWAMNVFACNIIWKFIVHMQVYQERKLINSSMHQLQLRLVIFKRFHAWYVIVLFSHLWCYFIDWCQKIRDKSISADGFCLLVNQKI